MIVFAAYLFGHKSASASARTQGCKCVNRPFEQSIPAERIKCETYISLRDSPNCFSFKLTKNH